MSVVCDIIDIDTTLSYGLTSSNSEGISLTTSANLKETNSTTFTHSKIVNPTFTNLEVINRTTASHMEQTSTDSNIQPTDVTKYQKIAESVSGMKGNIYIDIYIKRKTMFEIGLMKTHAFFNVKSIDIFFHLCLSYSVYYNVLHTCFVL